MKKFLTLFALIIFSVPLPALADNLTMTTYYPAPSGNYDQLIARTLTVATTSTFNGATTFTGAMTINGGITTTGNLTSNGDLIFSPDQTARFIRSATSGGAIRLRGNNAANTDRDLQFGAVTTAGAWTSHMTVANGGNVGIGTTTPERLLHIRGGQNQVATILEEIHNSPGNSADVMFRRARGNLATPLDVQVNDSIGAINMLARRGSYVIAASIASAVEELPSATVARARITFSTADSAGTQRERARIDRDGNVGIGTITPLARLHILNPLSAQLIIEADRPETAETNHPSIRLLQDGGRMWSTIGFGGPDAMQNTLRIINSANLAADVGGIILGNSDLNQFYVAPSGNVGIDIMTPVTKLDVNGHIALGPTANKFMFTESGDNWLRLRNSTNNAFRDLYVGQLMSNGNVWLAQTPGTSLVVGFPGNNTGAVWAYRFLRYSDKRLKENIVPIDNALTKTLALQGVYYNMKDVPSEKRMGLIAQDAEKVIPEVVATDKDGIKSIAYEETIGLLIEAIKEQQTQIVDQKKELEDIKERLKKTNL